MRKFAVALALTLLVSCSNNQGWDQLEAARRRVHPAPCSSTPAVAGLASVHGNPREGYLGDWVVVSVCQLHDLVTAAAAEQQPITLFINGLDTGNAPVGVDHDSGQLIFILDRNDANKDLWQPLLYAPLFDRTTTMHLSVGIRGRHPLSRVQGANLDLQLNKLYLDWTSWFWFGLLAAVVIALVMFARRSDMLREGPTVAGTRRPFSLARTQMAWWFFLVVVGYVFIWMVTGDRDTIPPSLLGMMGISAATAIAAAAISPAGDAGAKRREAFDAEIKNTEAAMQQVTADMAESEALRPVLEPKAAELQARKNELVARRAEAMANFGSSGGWKDLVQNERGSFALDRFQIVVWSLVMGGVFLTSVLWDLTMPEFSATMLALMGVSAGTYLGFQLPQK